MPLMIEKPIFLLTLLLIPIIWILLLRTFQKDSRRHLHIFVGILRSLLIASLSLALSDPRLIKSSDNVNVFFCMDVSESIDRDMEKDVLRFIRNAVNGMEEEDQAGLLVFGKEPSIERSLTVDYQHPDYQSLVNKNFTNIYAALELAMGKLPRTGQNRIVLFTDGNENLDHALEMAYLASSLGIEIYPVPLSHRFSQREIRVESLETPSDVQLNTPFEGRLVISSTERDTGELTLKRNDEIILNRPMILQPGKNTISFSDILEKQGLYRYQAIINTLEDSHFQNNIGISFVRATRPPGILYITSNLEKPSPPVLALQSQGFDIVGIRPEGIPAGIYDLVDYNAIVMDNVTGDTIPFGIMENIEKYVRDMGGGLVMIGGDKSFGLGHYVNTPVEKALPVFMDIPTSAELSGVCIILLIDKSHSMVSKHANKSKLEMAKIAAFSTVELLNPIDSVGILAFDADFRWIVPITRVTERQRIADQLSTLKEEGGTDLYPALKDTFRVLRNYAAAKKHIIILSDGQTKEADFKPLVESIKGSGMTISTVAVGTSADLKLMGDIAEWGGGRGYYTDDPDNIPRIFTDETKVVSKMLIVEKEMQPMMISPGEVLSGISSDDLPIVYGHILTHPKSSGSVLLQTQEGPLLVTGRYGLGRSVAFTSDLSGKWGKDWVLWEHYGKFLSQMIKWAQKKETPRNISTTIHEKGGTGRFLVDVLDNRNRFINNLTLNIRVLFPNETSKEIPLDQISPGRYAAAFPAEEVGDYYINLVENNETGPVSSQTYGFGIPYTEEFVMKDVNETLLKQLAQVTGGALLKQEGSQKQLFLADSKSNVYGAPLWPYLTGFFFALLIADVAIRKVMDFSHL